METLFNSTGPAYPVFITAKLKSLKIKVKREKKERFKLTTVYSLRLKSKN